jgi:hypothetical protein
MHMETSKNPSLADPEPSSQVPPGDSGERGFVALIASAAMSAILLAVIASFIVTSFSSRLVTGQLRYRGQAMNGADAGLTDALSWFNRQTTQPVTGFAPVRNLAATPPVNDTENQTVGIVRTYPISTATRLYGRYEVRIPNATDVSTQRGKPAAGTVWQVEADGIIFVDSDGDQTLDWTDSNGNGYYDQGEPGEAVAMRKLRADFQRLALVLPAGSAAVQGSNCGQIDTTVGTTRARVRGSFNGLGIACANATGNPVTTGTSISGSTAVLKTVNPYNAGVSSVFGVSQSELVGLANLVVPNVASLPATLPPMSLIVIQGNATFTTAQPLNGSGILVVFGNLTIPGAYSTWDGVIYTTGTYSQTAPSIVNGAVVGLGSIQLVGTAGDYAEVDWDASIVQQVRNELGGYRFSRAPYLVP